MLRGVWGKKIGMTQFFSENDGVIPVTVINLADWIVTVIKNKQRDGYDAIQVGCKREKYADQAFSNEWLKKPKQYFGFLREIKVADANHGYEVGQSIDFGSALSIGEKVNVRGTTKGYGFQGVVKRHGFRGGSASHGPRFGRWPGSVGAFRSQGKVIKGKRLPGHMGCTQRVMRQLEVINIEPASRIALVKGSVPGSSGSLVFMQKA